MRDVYPRHNYITHGKVWVIPTNEDLMIARHTRTLLCSTGAAQHV